MDPIFVGVYIAFGLLAGLCGMYRRMGFFATFLVSLVITPVLMLLVLVLTAPARAERERRPQKSPQRN